MIARAIRLLLAILLPVVATACAPAPDKGPLVFAAASLTEAVEEIADLWTQNGNARPVLAFAGTASNARLIASGAPGDLFISADEAWMDELARLGAIDRQSRAVIASNRLVLIAPRRSKLALSITEGMPIEQALGTGRLAIADPAAVPAGRYAREALVRLSAWPKRKERMILTENVRLALALVARGEAQLGIVYATDAKKEPGGRVLGTFPEWSHSPIRYPAARITGSVRHDANDFLVFLQSQEAQGIFRKHGFLSGDAR